MLLITSCTDTENLPFKVKVSERLCDKCQSK